VNSGDRVRLQLTLHYDGSGFHGWQVQKEDRTVQGELETALERLTGAHRSVIGSGRTDSGVHATGQVATVDVPSRWSAGELQRALNAVLPRTIWVSRVRPVSARFHPRYDAISRSYVYRLGTASEAQSPFHRFTCWALAETVDPALLTSAASVLSGEHSFRAFAKAGQEQRGDRCTVHTARWEAWPPLGFAFHMSANRYLHHMVRYLVGTMVDIARGRRPLGDMADLLAGSPGLIMSRPAPPEGLFLSRVEYPPELLDPTFQPDAPQRGTHGETSVHEDLP
jgi:tRNA pseudouridine38-40 synthase